MPLLVRTSLVALALHAALALTSPPDDPAKVSPRGPGNSPIDPRDGLTMRHEEPPAYAGNPGGIGGDFAEHELRTVRIHRDELRAGVAKSRRAERVPSVSLSVRGERGSTVVHESSVT